jgi:hypothetical protein
MGRHDENMTVSAADIGATRRAIAGKVLRTPVRPATRTQAPGANAVLGSEALAEAQG